MSGTASRVGLVILNSLLLCSLVLSGSPSSDRTSRTLDLPLLFEQDEPVPGEGIFRARAGNHLLILSKGEIAWLLASRTTAPFDEPGTVQRHVVRLSLLGAEPAGEPRGEERAVTRTSHFRSFDASHWRVANENFRKVRFREVYPGIDLVFYGSEGRVEYDFEVAPGSDPDRIRLEFTGVDSLAVNAQGSLVLSTPVGDLTHMAPRAFQQREGRRTEVPASYQIEGGTIGFKLGYYDSSRPLTIDPVLSFATYLGGSAGDVPGGIAVDAEGNFYVVGSTGSMDFPVRNATQSELAGGGSPLGDVFVTKIDSSGRRILYSTYIGGEGTDIGRGIAVDSQGRAVVTGTTFSDDFPFTNGAFQTECGGQCPFAVRLSPDGSQLSYATFIGRGDGNGIALDSQDRAVIVGRTTSSDFPIMNAFQEERGGGSEGFVSKLTADGSGLVFSTFLGGSGDDNLIGRQEVAIDSADAIYVTGRTRSDDYPMMNAFQAVHGGMDDAYVSKLTAAGALDYSTYLGGSEDDLGQGIDVDSDGNVWVVGETRSEDFPTQDPFNADYQGGATGDAFVAKLSAAGNQLLFSTYFGGTLGDTANDVAVDNLDRAVFVGNAGGSNFPAVKSLREFDGIDNFVAKFSADGATLEYATSISAGDEDIFVATSGSKALVAGNISSGNYLVLNALQPRSNGSTEVFLAEVTDAGTLYFAQYANGGGASSEILLTNSSDTSPSNATVRFRGDDGMPLEQDVTVADSLGRTYYPQGTTSEIEVEVPPLGLVRIASDGMGEPTAGSVTVDFDVPLGGVIRFTLTPFGTAGVGESQLVRAFITPVRRMGINTGVAVYNPQDSQIGLRMRLLGPDGVQVPGGLRTLALTPPHHPPTPIPPFPPSADTENLTGTITVETTSQNALIVGTALELGSSAGQFTTLPITPIP